MNEPMIFTGRVAGELHPDEHFVELREYDALRKLLDGEPSETQQVTATWDATGTTYVCGENCCGCVQCGTNSAV